MTIFILKHIFTSCHQYLETPMIMQLSKFKLLQEILYKTGDNQFYNAIKIALCTATVLLFFYSAENTDIVFYITLGILLSSSSDINGNFKDKVISLTCAALAMPIITITLNLLYSITPIFFIVFIFLVFFSSLISLYGQRATQFSFTLMLSICLSFIHISNPVDLFSNALYMFIGGAFYLLVSITFYLIMPSRYINIEMATCMNEVSAYLKTRAQLWDTNVDIDDLKEKRLATQVSIDDSFKKINEYLELNKMKTINSKSNRKIIIAISFLTEIIELALSTSFNNKQVILKLNENPQVLSSIKALTLNFTTIIEQLSATIRTHSTYTFQSSLSKQYTSLQLEIKKIENISADDQVYVDTIMQYLGKQVEMINGLERVYTDGISVNDPTLAEYADTEKSFAPNPYRFKTLFDNLNYKSIYFRYALRVTIALLVGLILGYWMDLQKEYWVLLTIVVIMRPGYGLTRSRAMQRIIGSIIGGLIGIVILYFIHDSIVLIILGIISMILAYWYTSSDYKIGVTFMTLFIIIISGTLQNGGAINVVYKLVDTFAGALIALLATSYLWPSWESNSIKANLIASISSTIDYINQVKNIYFMKDDETTEFKISRQNAFINIGNLMEAYQRLVQEPKNKQVNRSELYEIAVLNQTLVGAVASVGTFLRAHQGNENLKSYAGIVNNIISNLHTSLNYFGETTTENPNKTLTNTDNTPNTETNITQLKALENQKIAALGTTDSDQKTELEESQLVLDQLTWIVNLSEQIEKTAKNIK